MGLERFYRFQKTTDLEKESQFEFLSDIFFTIGGECNDWEELEESEKDEVREEILDKWDVAIQLWWNKHRESFSSEEFDDEVDYLIDMLSNLNIKSLLNFMKEYKMDGVFAVSVHDYPDKNELFRLSKSPNFGLNNEYLVEMEVENSIFFGKEYGYLVKPTRIIAIECVPQQYIK